VANNLTLCWGCNVFPIYFKYGLTRAPSKAVLHKLLALAFPGIKLPFFNNHGGGMDIIALISICIADGETVFFFCNTLLNCKF